MFTHKVFSLFYLRPNMVFFGHFVPSRSVNTYTNIHKCVRTNCTKFACKHQRTVRVVLINPGSMTSVDLSEVYEGFFYEKRFAWSTKPVLKAPFTHQKSESRTHVRIKQQSHLNEVMPGLSRRPVKSLIVKMGSLTHIPATHTQTRRCQVLKWLSTLQIVLTFPSMHLIRQTIATFAIKVLWYHNFYHELG